MTATNESDHKHETKKVKNMANVLNKPGSDTNKGKTFSEAEVDALIANAKSQAIEDDAVNKKIELLKLYGDSDNCFITSETLIERLYSMNIPKHCLDIIRNEDEILSDSQIWEKVRLVKDPIAV